jgi:2-keto-4-pentenoate hydratase/2-oxohepta-3-ene-1,7-dioic acid hydratase in catechol pathway
MRLANVKGRLTTFAEGRAVDVEHESGGLFEADPQAVYDQWDAFTEWASSIGAIGGGPVEPAQLGAPVPRPGQVFAIGLNYRDHAAEAGLHLPTFPHTFTKFPSCVVGPDTAVEVVGDTSDWEVELVVVIGRPAHRIDAAEAWNHIAGVTIGQDLSERTRQLAGPAPQFNLGKSFPGYGPTGPWLVTPDELPDRDDLALTCTLDGEVVQSSSTAQLIFPVADLVAKLASVVTLRPGDLIFTGTPSGVGHARSPQRFLVPGQELVSEIDGVGRLTTSLIAPAG